MIELDQLSNEDRQPYFNQVANEKGLPNYIIEKDYWVVWTLDRLMSIEGLNQNLTFKGGTSLSKIYNAIKRFSEDIDLTITKKYLGLYEDNEPKNGDSFRKRRIISSKLSEECSKFIKTRLLEELHEKFSSRLGTIDNWELTVCKNDACTLLFKYPTNFSDDNYNPAKVKLEFGLKIDAIPSSRHFIQSYTKEVLKEKVDEPEISVQVLNAEKTFWEKATILHRYANWPEDKVPKPGQSRHYYDLHCLLLQQEIKNLALIKSELLDTVAREKSLYYYESRAKYENAKKGTLKLVPSKKIGKSLQKDYKSMENMFFNGQCPTWEEIMQIIQNFETEFNT